MLLGTWKNIEELEECLNLDELKLLIDASRERELRNQKFFAALKGIDLDAQQAKDAEAEFRRVQQRVEARKAGMSEEQFELNEFGIDIETDEDE